MREPALIHAAGPAVAGKPTFIERPLDTAVAYAICVRAERDATLQREQTSAARNHAELRRYRDAGESAVTLFRFAEPDAVSDVTVTSALRLQAPMPHHKLRNEP